MRLSDKLYLPGSGGPTLHAGVNMPNTSTASAYAYPQATDPLHRAMPLRIKVFCGVWLLSLALGMGINFSRPAVYQATARVQIAPPDKVLTAIPLAQTLFDDANQLVLTEIEILTSRPLLDQVAERLRTQGLLRSETGNPVQSLQNMLQVTRVDDALVVKLQAQGPQKDLLAPLINTLLEVYRAQRVAAGDASSHTQLAAAQVELQIIEAKVAEKQRALDEVHWRANIPPGERDESQALVQRQELASALAQAAELEASAVSRIHALEQAISPSKSAPQVKDHPLLANLAQQQAPEHLTAQHLALAEARQALVSARATANRLQQRMMEGKLEVAKASRDLGELQGLQDDLKRLTAVRNIAADKLLMLQATDTTRTPQLTILEPAVTPDAPFMPLYWRDAGVVVVASMVLGFLAVWFVEFFNRQETVPERPEHLVHPTPWTVSTPAEARRHTQDVSVGPVSHRPPPLRAALHGPVGSLARELDADEVHQLLHAAAPKNRPLLACLLCGLCVDEVVRLQWQHLDTRRLLLQVPGQASRALPLSRPLRALADAAEKGVVAAAPSDLLFTEGAGKPLGATGVQAIVLISALDADLSDPETVTPEALRHTYMAFLVRQGVRLSELGALVGGVSTDMLKALTTLAQTAPRGGRSELQTLLPALR
ncbi:tyrosine-type recombinase/integrase [Rhodoferax sp. U2-2l]|uniref:GumC family protein n=1 Tax=Rhodoferax sp. U2-2l TaxID=2884000 RepID=UPI001D0B11D6|nr:tyrosine-type recombinase/integrase [Rhodoferax sp. U2-2l]MCB8746508.1 tyrosine-type recombinase/integrase [Rhodoferax sp. U2-2l]